jgi:hypothetical protein
MSLIILKEARGKKSRGKLFRLKPDAFNGITAILANARPAENCQAKQSL